MTDTKDLLAEFKEDLNPTDHKIRMGGTIKYEEVSKTLILKVNDELTAYLGVPSSEYLTLTSPNTSGDGPGSLREYFATEIHGKSEAMAKIPEDYDGRRIHVPFAAAEDRINHYLELGRERAAQAAKNRADALQAQQRLAIAAEEQAATAQAQLQAQIDLAEAMKALAAGNQQGNKRGAK